MAEDGNGVLPGLGKKTRNGLKLVLMILGLIVGLFFAGRLAVIMFPFTIAIIVAQLLEPAIRFIMRKFKAKRRWIAIVLTLLFYSLLGFLITIGVTNIIKEIIELMRDIPALAFNVIQWVEKTLGNFNDTLEQLPPEIPIMLNNALSSAIQSITGIAQSLALLMINGLRKLPQLLLFIIITVISTVFFTSDRDKIFGIAKKHLPDSWINTTLDLKNDLIFALLAYIKAQGKIMLFVAAELFIGFSIIGNEYALLAAIVIAIADALPVVGAGLALIPTSIFGFVTGDLRLGIGVGIMYFVTLGLRQMLEPKVLGGEIGLHPLLMLSSMFLGYRLLGGIGFFLGPITTIIVKSSLIVFLGGRTIKGYIDGEPRMRLSEIKAKKEEQKGTKKSLFSFFKKKN